MSPDQIGTDGVEYEPYASRVPHWIQPADERPEANSLGVARAGTIRRPTASAPKHSVNRGGCSQLARGDLRTNGDRAHQAG